MYCCVPALHAVLWCEPSNYQTAGFLPNKLLPAKLLSSQLIQLSCLLVTLSDLQKTGLRRLWLAVHQRAADGAAAAVRGKNL